MRRREKAKASQQDPILGVWAEAAESWLGGGAGSSTTKGRPREREDDRYEKWLRRALSTDLSGMASLEFLWKAGVDKAGRHVFVVVGSRFPARVVEDDLPLLYTISVMDQWVHLPFTVVFVNSNFSMVNNQPLPAWFAMAHEV